MSIVTLESVMALNPCAEYPAARVRALLEIAPYDALCSLPHEDARWALSRLMTSEQRLAWAKGCADRAKDYARGSAARAAAWAAARAAEAAEAAWAAAAAAAEEAAWAAAVWAAEEAAESARQAAWAAARAAESARQAAWAAEAEHHLALRHALMLMGLPW